MVFSGIPIKKWLQPQTQKENKDKVSAQRMCIAGIKTDVAMSLPSR